MEIIGELITVNRHVPAYPIQDKFMRGMKEYDQTRQVPIYLAFTAQMFLDIHHILREEVFSAHAKCAAEMELMHEDLQQHLEFHKNLKIDHWPSSNDQQLRALQNRIKWIESDPIYQAKVKAYRKLNVDFPLPRQRLTKYSPVISGLMLYHFRAQVYDIGITVANAWGSITYALHLYIALLQEKLLTGPDNPQEQWADMDAVLGLLGNSNFYVGNELPKTTDGYFKKSCLQMGTSAAAFIENKHKRIQNMSDIASRSGPRGIKEGIPVSRMFEDRYLHNTGQVDWTPEHVDDIVSRSLWEEEEDEEEQENGTLVLSPIDDPEKLRERRKAAKQHAKKTADGARLSPEKLVRALAITLQAESLEMSFTYLTLHRSAWEMLRAVRDSCEPLLRERFGPGYMERESQMPWVVGWIFMTAVRGDGTLMQMAATAMKARIEAGDGATALRKLHKMGFEIEV
ncbi:hypothetical protein VMCG_05163 [Cytospora schulzeri]|uniref:Uncharacterized protein n=1 Tax=Cytospora schulzeri TaxID=448051 RepID=A0A423WQF3_9PEZI|nr:hypothetical protein VMCG_05163 [Valsa malicola]